ncbi:DNA-binding XRE family transcriptional regulator [Paenibacillus harenae]|nr:DNA-binding XRE family transcriptional regulator [Paenibacillus harenae]
MSDLDKYGEFGFRKDYKHDPNDCTSIYSARRSVIINMDYLPLHHQIKTKRIHDGLSQEQLGKIVRLHPSTISLIETGQLLIMKNRYKEFEKYLYEDWYSDGKLIDSFTEDYHNRPMKEMDIEEQRAYWKSITDDDPDLWGTIL